MTSDRPDAVLSWSTVAGGTPVASRPGGPEGGPVTSDSPRLTVAPDRRIDVSGSFNLRDLGGLPTADGRRVRRGRVFRSDYPTFAEADADALAGLRLSTVVDLRRGSEAAVECVDWVGLGIDYRRWPLTAGAADSWHARYTSYLTHRPETVAGAVGEVIRPEGHAVLFHCAAGKDRTGVVAALLLLLLGVAEEDVVEDYLLSAESVEPVVSRLLAMESYAAMLADSSVADQQPRADHVLGLLRWVEDHGGAETWLVGQGVAAERIADFRSAMLED